MQERTASCLVLLLAVFAQNTKAHGKSSRRITRASGRSPEGTAEQPGVGASVRALLAVAISGTVGLAVAAVAQISQAAALDARTPWIVSQQGVLTDQRTGRAADLHGVNVMLGRRDVYAGAMSLSPTFVRIVASWNRLEPLPPEAGIHRWDAGAVTALDQEIAFFAARGVAVLIDLHQAGWSQFFAGGVSGVPSWFYADGRFAPDQADAAEGAFWTSERARSLQAYSAVASFIAQRYASAPNVIGYEFVNEPPTGSLGDSSAAEAAVFNWESDLERSVQPALSGRLFVVSCCALGDEQLWDLRSAMAVRDTRQSLAVDYHDYWLSPRSPSPSVSRYTGTADDQQRHLESIIQAFRSLRVPVIVGEWGVGRATINASDYQQQLLSLFQTDAVPNARWFYWPDDDGPFNLLGPGNAPTKLATQLQRFWTRR